MKDRSGMTCSDPQAGAVQGRVPRGPTWGHGGSRRGSQLKGRREGPSDAASSISVCWQGGQA